MPTPSGVARPPEQLNLPTVPPEPVALPVAEAPIVPEVKPSGIAPELTSKEKDILFREPWTKTLEGPSSDLNILTAKA